MSRVSNFFRSYNRLSKEAKAAGRDDILTILEDVRKFVTTENFMERATYDGVGDFFEYTDKQLSDLQGGSTSSYAMKRRRHSDRLYVLFGEGFFDLAYSEEGVSEMAAVLEQVKSSLNGLTAKELLPGVVRSYLEDEEYPLGIRVSDCPKEAYVLRAFSVSGIKSTIDSVDRGKLAYLIAVLNGEEGTVDEQNALRGGMAKVPALSMAGLLASRR